MYQYHLSSNMTKRNLTRDDLFLVVANLLPVYGVWFLGWNAVDAFVAYALETLIVGVLTLLKMILVAMRGKKHVWYGAGGSTNTNGLFFIAFFIIHFGLFAAMQTAIFSQSAGITPPGSGMFHFFFHWLAYINKDIAIMLGGFIVSYLARSFIPFILTGEYKTISMARLMFQPYGRIFIQQFTVILGSMLLSFRLGKGFILVFALVKIFFEVYVNFDNVINRTVESMEKETGKSE